VNWRDDGLDHGARVSLQGDLLAWGGAEAPLEVRARAGAQGRSFGQRFLRETCFKGLNAGLVFVSSVAILVVRT
jgi:hypothetical protein